MEINYQKIIYLTLTFTALVLNLSLAQTSQADVFAVTGSLNDARYGATATLLSNGQVLVAGGYYSNGTPLSSAELYNPATGAWTVTGSLNVARYGATATLLPNGEVLVAGGVGPLASAELYNPATGTWTVTGLLNTARWGATATLLPNGEVLVAGGFNYYVGYLASAELYNPATGTWTATGSLNDARWWATATLLPNGEVLVAGGYNGSNLSSAELYNPATGTWTVTGALNTARTDATATLLSNGEVLVAGGSIYSSAGSGPPLASAELYNPATGTWTVTGTLNNARGEATATLLSNGEVLAAGGDDGTNALSSAELYNPATGSWTLTDSLNNARYEATATLLPSGQVLVAGGENSSGAPLSSTELYNYVSTSTAATVTPCGLTATAGDGKVMLTWNAPGNATGYNVASSTAISGPYAIIATNLNTLFFTNTGLSNGTTYYFVVSAVNAAGVSSNSVPVSALPFSMAAPFFNIALSGGQTQLIWPSANTGWSLQVQTNTLNTGMGNNWVTVPGSMLTNQMSFPINPANESVFFRLVYPQN
jgi:hypothetical protein